MLREWMKKKHIYLLVYIFYWKSLLTLQLWIAIFFFFFLLFLRWLTVATLLNFSIAWAYEWTSKLKLTKILKINCCKSSKNEVYFYLLNFDIGNEDRSTPSLVSLTILITVSWNIWFSLISFFSIFASYI